MRRKRRPGTLRGSCRVRHVESRPRCRCRARITTRSSPPTATPAAATRCTASTSTRAYLDDFDAWRDKYKNPFRDLQDGGRVRNWDDERRNGELEADGIVGEVVFPNTVPPFFPSFVLFARPPKPDEYEHRLAGIRAHNRWLADWCARFPDRRAGIGQIFLNDVDDAIDDVRWIKEHGLRGGVLISAIPPDVDYVKPLYDPVYDPLWTVCEDLGVPVNSHGGTGLPDYGKYPSPTCSSSPRSRSTRSGRSCSCCSPACSSASRISSS